MDFRKELQRVLSCPGEFTDEQILGVVEVHVKNTHRLVNLTEFLTDSGLGKIGESCVDEVKRLLTPQKTYWDGVEPLRVGHIVGQGVVECFDKEFVVTRTPEGKISFPRPEWVTTHPFAKLTEQEREFLQSQIEAGVVRLC